MITNYLAFLFFKKSSTVQALFHGQRYFKKRYFALNSGIIFVDGSTHQANEDENKSRISQRSSFQGGYIHHTASV